MNKPPQNDAARSPAPPRAGAAAGAAPTGPALSLVQRRAGEAVLAVLAGNNADAAIARVDTSAFDGATRAALTDLTYGTLRFLGELRGIVRQFVHSKPEPLIEAILWIAVYQLSHGKTEPPCSRKAAGVHVRDGRGRAPGVFLRVSLVR